MVLMEIYLLIIPRIGEHTQEQMTAYNMFSMVAKDSYYVTGQEQDLSPIIQLIEELSTIFTPQLCELKLDS